MSDDAEASAQSPPMIAGSPVDVASLPNAVPPVVADVAPGGSFDLRVHPVAKRIGDTTFAMLSYGGSIPGPTLRVRQGSEITVNVTNGTDMETTVHWHGLRLENRYDGVPHETQAPIPPGGRYTHRLTFPDAGLYWYHPHIREDYAQEMGLYGTIIVEPTDPAYWPAADRRSHEARRRGLGSVRGRGVGRRRRDRAVRARDHRRGVRRRGRGHRRAHDTRTGVSIGPRRRRRHR